MKTVSVMSKANTLENITERQIINAEERLRRAMLDADLVTLDELVAADLMFTNHVGQLLGKDDDLELHRCGILKFHTLEPSEMVIKATADCAVVSVRMKLACTFGGAPFAGEFRYTRIWRRSSPGVWQVAAGHFSAIGQ